MIVRGSSCSDVLGRSMLNAPSSPCSPTAMPMPATMPSTEATSPTSERLDDHRDDDLPPRRPERAQQRELPGALRDDDRERVEDDERADEQRHGGEHQQRGSEEPELFLQVLGRLVGDRRRRDRLRRRRASAASTDARSSLAATPSSPTTLIASKTPSLPSTSLRGLGLEDRERRAAEVVGFAEPGDADDREPAGIALEQDLDLVSDRRGSRCAPSRRRPPRRRVRSGALPPRISSTSPARSFQFVPIVGGPTPPITSSVAGSTIWAYALHVADGDRDAGDSHRSSSSRLVRQRRRARRRRSPPGPAASGSNAVAERTTTSDAADGLREQLLERRVHRVGEHVGAGDEPDAEHDRERGQHQPELLRQQALERGAPHGGSGLQRLEPIEHPVGGRIAHLVDDAVRRRGRRRGRHSSPRSRRG